MFQQVAFPQNKPNVLRPGVQQAPQQQSGGSGGFLGSLLGLGANFLLPGSGPIVAGLLNGNPSQMLSGIAGMAGGPEATGIMNGINPNPQAPTGAVNNAVNQAAQTTGGDQKKEETTKKPTAVPEEQQKIEKPESTTDGANPHQALQDLLNKYMLAQLFAGGMPSMFPIPHNPSMGLQQSMRSPWTGGVAGVAG